ncbi:hypothetical protein DJ76_06695 [Halorubrum ezzemoulense]|uniref:Uncharacterized protein n=1 Tax=Halorubrum ezzemoulense TaxID=337243 RepID=A0A256JZK7_HALEZ|nr:hypothetical protein DJ76_06695 [Halorubrum ezzemoulense]
MDGSSLPDHAETSTSLREGIEVLILESVDWQSLRDGRVPSQIGIGIDPATAVTVSLTALSVMFTVVYTMYDRRATEVNTALSDVRDDLYQIASGCKLIGRGASIEVEWETVQPWQRAQVSEELRADIAAFERDLREFQKFDAELEGELREAIRESDVDTGMLLPERLTRTNGRQAQFKNACRADNLDGHYIQDVEWIHLCGPALFSRDSPAQLREEIRSQIEATGAERDFNIDFWDRLNDSWAEHLHRQLEAGNPVQGVLNEFESNFQRRREWREDLISEADRLHVQLQAETSRWYPRLMVDITNPSGGFNRSTAALADTESDPDSSDESSEDVEREWVMERG